MPNVNKYLFLALKNIKKRKLRTWLTLLGIFIGIAAVVSLISLGAGLQNAIIGQFSSLGTDKLILTNAETGFGPPGSTAIEKLTDRDVDIVKSVSGVDIAIPRLLRMVKIEYNKNLAFGYAISMPEDLEEERMVYETVNIDVESGRRLKADDFRKIVLGSDYGKTEDFGKDIIVGSKLRIQEKDFEVIGILKASGTIQINGAMLMLDNDMKEILYIGDEWDMVNIKIAEGEDIEEVAEDIKEKLRKDRHEKVGEESFSVQTPTQALQSVSTILNIINVIIASIAGISLLVGGIGIANTMYTSVLERRREIGIMKAIGAKNADILKIFLIESSLLGLIGGIIGAIIGLSLAFGLSSVANAALGTQLLSVKVSWPLIIGAVGFSLIIGIVSGVFPARQASKLKPVDALRG